MTDDRFTIRPEEMQAYLDRANKLRAEAVRSSFIDFRDSLKSAFAGLARALRIPRTEQL